MSTEDGPGLRTTVFLKGCLLRCSWCHNPESISPEPQVWWIASRCIGCLGCVASCPEKAISAGKGIEIDRTLCTGCGICAEQCPASCIEALGTEWRSADLAAEVLKDRAYFEASGKGGVTFSGGEAAMQADFVAEVFSALSDAGIHTALDTAGFGSWEAFDRMLPHVDLVLFDIKEIDPERHRLFTGAGNAQALRTLSNILEWTGKREPEIWIRTPLIPGATAREENIRGIGAWLSEHRSKRITRWELCAFNDLCGDKYERLGIDWNFQETGLLSLSEMEGFLAIARGAYTDPAAVLWTGPTKA